MDLSPSDYSSIQRWIYRNARPLDLARWQYHFENGSREAVLAALAAYQNADGGFGNALEPDQWNPNSSPYVTGVAVNLLEEIEFRDHDHALVRGILRYLESTPDFDGNLWASIVDTNNDYPHAPWWADRSYDWGYTPTALLAGFILFYASPNAPIYQKAEKIAGAAIETYLHGKMANGEAYNRVRREAEIACLHKMLTFLEGSPAGRKYDIAEIENFLGGQAQLFIEKDASRWNTYCWKPSVFVRSPDSIYYPGNEAAIAIELDYILNKRNPAGIWDITWEWGAYEKEFAVAENWWKANIIIENLRLLKSFGRF